MPDQVVFHWNDDKPHRCPDCHGVWNRDGMCIRSYIRIRRPLLRSYRPYWWIPVGWAYRAWWRTNTCQYCDTRFSGRARRKVP